MKREKKYIFAATLITLTIAFSGCNRNAKDKLRGDKLSEDKGNMIEFNLYYNSSNNENDSSVKEETRSINKDEVLGRVILDELIKGPSANGTLQSSLPKDSKLLSFTIKDNIGYVSFDFGADELKMAEAKEVAAVKAILMSLGQLSSIEKVKISIPKTNQSTFAGKIDITKPIKLDSIPGLQKNK